MRGRRRDSLGSRQRGVGVHAITVVTPDGRRVDASQQHLSPPPLEPWRRQQVGQLHKLFAEGGALAYRDKKTLKVNVGDNNHVTLRKYDLRLRELLPSLCDGSGTCDVYRTHPWLAGWMERFGVTTLPQLDAVHGQAPLGASLSATNTPGPDEFGYQTRRLWYTASGYPIASDHAITELDLYFPPQAAATAQPLGALATLQS